VGGSVYVIGGYVTSAVLSDVFAGAFTEPPAPPAGPIHYPAMGKMEIHGNVVRVPQGDRATIVVKGPADGTVTLTLFNRRGAPVGTIEKSLVLDGSGVGSVSFDGRIGGKALANGIYTVVASGAVSARAKMAVQGAE
jgi:hypothetical protein